DEHDHDSRPPDAERRTPNAQNLLRTANIPPRTKAYAAKLKLSEADLAELVRSSSGKLMPEDIDRFLEAKGKQTSDSGAPVKAKLVEPAGFADIPQAPT